MSVVSVCVLGCQAQITPSGGGIPTETGTGTGTNGGPAATTSAGGSATGGVVSGSTSGNSGTTTGGGGTSSVPADCSQPQASVVHMRLLTASQYDNTIRDIFQISGSFADGFSQGLDDIALEQRANVAAAVAAEASMNLPQWAPCTPPSTGSPDACVEQIVDEIGAKAYRHPLGETERAELKALFDAGIQEQDFATGVEWFITGLLQSPDFMYEVVRPATGETPGEVRPLAAHEYASRLAYFIWDGPPDEPLSAAAANDELEDPTLRAAQIARMLEDQRFLRGIEQFYMRWLPMKGFAEIARDTPGFDEGVVAALSTSLLMSATELYRATNPNIAELFSGDTYYLNDTLLGFYGIAGTTTTFTPTTMAGESRRGILTHPAMMALLARPDESFPIGRGLHLLRNVLCQVIAAPDGIEIPPLPPAQEGVSTRERLESHTASAVCQGCHSMINPAGFAFEAFDEVGRFRTIDHGRPVDTSGALELGTDIDGTFASGDELLAKLGDSASVRACFVEKYLGFALDRVAPEPTDACSMQTLRDSFEVSGDLKELVVSVAASDAFRMRLAEGVGQ